MAPNNKAKAAKTEARVAARTAANTGSLTKELRQDLKIAGVNPNVISNIRNTNQQVKAANARSAEAAAGVGSLAQVIDQLATGGQKIGQQSINSAITEGTLMPTAQQIAEYAKSRGYVLDDVLMADYGTITRDKRFPNIADDNRASYLNYDFGKSFGSKDIRDMQKAGYSNRQIFQLAQAADAGAQVKNRNKVDRRLSIMSQEALTPKTGFMSQGNRAKQVGWEGFGNALSRYKISGNPFSEGYGYEKQPGGINLRNPLRGGLPSLTTPYTPDQKYTDLLKPTVTDNNNNNGIDGGTDTIEIGAVDQNNATTTAKEYDPYGVQAFATSFRGAKRGKKMSIASTRINQDRRSSPTGSFRGGI